MILLHCSSVIREEGGQQLKTVAKYFATRRTLYFVCLCGLLCLAGRMHMPYCLAGCSRPCLASQDVHALVSLSRRMFTPFSCLAGCSCRCLVSQGVHILSDVVGRSISGDGRQSQTGAADEGRLSRLAASRARAQGNRLRLLH